VLAADVVVLDKNEAVLIFVVLAELDVCPVQSNQFTTPQASPHGQEEDWAVCGSDTLRGGP